MFPNENVAIRQMDRDHLAGKKVNVDLPPDTAIYDRMNDIPKDAQTRINEIENKELDIIKSIGAFVAKQDLSLIYGKKHCGFICIISNNGNLSPLTEEKVQFCRDQQFYTVEDIDEMKKSGRNIYNINITNNNIHNNCTTNNIKKQSNFLDFDRIKRRDEEKNKKKIREIEIKTYIS